MTITISLGSLVLICISLVLLVLATWACIIGGLFDCDFAGLTIGVYCAIWAAPSLIAWAAWAMWLQGGA